MTRIPVRSSDLCAVGYDASLRVLEIELNDSAIYRYTHVPAHVHAQLMSAYSKGGYFHHAIKPAYPCTRVR